MRKLLALLVLAAAAIIPASSNSAALAACPDLGGLYADAAPGQVIQIPSCSGGDSTFEFDPLRTDPADVVFQPASGATVTLGALTIHGAKHVTIKNMQVTDDIYGIPTPQTDPNPDSIMEDWTFENVVTNQFFVRTAKDVLFKGGQIGPLHNGNSPTVGNYDGQPVSQNVVFDGVLFFNVDRDNAPGAHVECLFIQDSDGTKVLNSTFRECSIMGIFASPNNGNPVTNVTLRNNNFEELFPEVGGGAVVFNVDNQVARDWLIDGNHFTQKFYLENATAPSTSNIVYCSNNTGADPIADVDGSITFSDCGSPPPPPPPPATQCADGVDNDSDGAIDLVDPGCVDAADNDEFNEPPPPPPAEYHPACEPTCDEQIAQLQADKAALQAKIDAALDALN